MTKYIFVGNKLTMDGVRIEIPEEIEYSKESIDEAVYNVFESVFIEKEYKNFIKTMKMNNLLFSFMEHHIKIFIRDNKEKIESLREDSSRCVRIKEMAEYYFSCSLESYKNKVLNVEF